ncbi:MAG: FumA C-terminus/TtdB family hydratase beta subunit [Methanimicrococcus sp.]|nr:FumA C-terminus/TtdB family hydratase beta subunit [Methanimicrococcus sp.]
MMTEQNRPPTLTQDETPTSSQTQNQNKRSAQTYYLKTPLEKEDVLKLNAGDIVYLSGMILTARDEAHLRMIEFDEEKKPLPFDLENAVLYHCGPVMEKLSDENADDQTDKKNESKNGKGGDKWRVVAAGPTTSDRMTKMTPTVLKNHTISALIGKGGMENIADILNQKCVYLSYTGGCAAMAAEMIQTVDTVFWEDLGMPEAVWMLTVQEFGPLIVGVDAHGNDIFRDVKEKANSVFKKMKG